MKFSDLSPTVRAFARAVAWGSLAGAAPFFLLSFPIGIEILFDENPGSGWWNAFLIILLPLLITLSIVLTASVLIGLPLTFALSRLGKERGETYLLAGILLGSLPFFAAMLLGGDFMMGIYAFAGGLGGGVTGEVWGRYRDDLAAQRLPE